MRRAAVLLALAVGIASGIQGQNADKQAQRAKPMAPLAWLVGGVWTADTSKMGGGMQRIETRYAWSDNSAFIRFNTHFVINKQELHNYDGSFFWDPERATLAMWYMNPRNEIFQGPVQVDGDIMTMEFQAKDSQEKEADFRVTVTRKTNDRYGWRLEEKQAEGWKEMLALEYLRTPDLRKQER